MVGTAMVATVLTNRNALSKFAISTASLAVGESMQIHSDVAVAPQRYGVNDGKSFSHTQ
jgi:hypothetical protein